MQSAGVDIEAGTFSGPGSVQGDLKNAAALDLGTAAGTLNVTGDYTQTATGTCPSSWAVRPRAPSTTRST